MSDFKIRTIPRKNEKPSNSAPEAGAQRLGRLMIYLSITALCLGILGVLTSRMPVQRKLARALKAETQVDANINRYMTDTHLKELWLKRKLQLENQQTAPSKMKADGQIMPEDNRSYGVQMDQDDSAEKLYQELYGHQNTYGDNLDEKINQRLANRKWLNEQERAERITFVRNFIRQAYEKGYEVEINQNLIVTGVKKITQPKQFNIEQVLDRVAKQGY